LAIDFCQNGLERQIDVCGIQCGCFNEEQTVLLSKVLGGLSGHLKQQHLKQPKKENNKQSNENNNKQRKQQQRQPTNKPHASASNHTCSPPT
jgi:sRNA-binding protein